MPQAEPGILQRMADFGFYQLFRRMNANRSYTGQYKHYFKAMAAAFIPALEPFVPPSERRRTRALKPAAAAEGGGGGVAEAEAGSRQSGREEEEEEADEDLIMMQLARHLYRAVDLGAPGANPRDL